jgi:hypothetical protein
MDARMIALVVGGTIVGLGILLHAIGRAMAKRELSPVSDQWLAEQKARRE